MSDFVAAVTKFFSTQSRHGLVFNVSVFCTSHTILFNQGRPVNNRYTFRIEYLTKPGTTEDAHESLG